MTIQTHMFRRGAVWTWRRRLPPQSTGSCSVQVSLRTTYLRLARKMARTRSMEFDRTLDTAYPSVPSPDALRPSCGRSGTICWR
ncbi:DUF6538 domain-containing protein [Pseudoroseicyclus tamaricis]|uniref:DUF6538 domain-containing protein n=1 Tax=Pseudoroseicyclus tamaricis TaxID=2705421 RepID=UPI003742DD46